MYYEREIKKLEKQIEELKAKQELHPVWKPEIEDFYYVTDVNPVSQLTWHYDEVDEHYLKVGNLFKTEQEAEDYVRSLKLIETIRRERFKAQGDWHPNEDEASYSVCWYRGRNIVDIYTTSWAFPSDVFGVWQYSGELMNVIDKYESELTWYFTEYLPAIN